MAYPADARWMASDTKRATVMNVENIFVQNEGIGRGGGGARGGQWMEERVKSFGYFLSHVKRFCTNTSK